MNIKFNHIEPKYKKIFNPKVGLIVLSTDNTIESDFNTICGNLPIDVFINRIHNENPLSKENLSKMKEKLKSVTEKILPDEKINTVAYACTSGTIAIGEDKVEKEILAAKPGCYVTSPPTSTMKAFNQMKIKKIALFTPYPESVNKTIFEYFDKKNIEILSFDTLNIDLDADIAKVDPKHLLKILTSLNTKNADALFISCTALPVLKILEEIENKISIPTLSSNQTLIWDTIRSVGYKNSIMGFGKLLRN
tara:strand:- start:213 stop:962 length:750 start_codon:yes stop_codon:yes gene_type:complete